MKQKFLIIEQLNFRHLPSALIGRFLGFEIRYLNLSGSLAGSSFYKNIQNYLLARKITDLVSTYHEKIRAHVKAVEQIELIYDKNFSQKALVREAVRKIGNAIDFSYKKAMVGIVRDYYTNMLTLSLFRKENPDARISFIPDRFLKVRRWLRKSGIQEDNKESVAIPVFSRVYRSLSTVFNYLKWIGIFLFFPVWIFSKIRKISLKKTQKFDYQVGLRVYKTDLSFFSKQRSIDFLIDGTSLNKDNTIFCVETQISDSYKEELNKRGYKIAYIQDMLKNVDVDFIKNVLLKNFLGMWASFLVRSVTAPAVVMESTLRNLQAYVLWKRFLSQYHLEHYVVYNDFTNEHVVRNMVLAQDGAKTWFYLHSRHHSDLFAPAQARDQYCHTIYSFLFYDNLVVWSNNIESMMRPNRIKRFLGLGCLWSEHIKEIEAQADFADLRRRYAQKAKGKIRKMIGVFDTTFGDNVVLTPQDMAVFAQGILQLLSDFPDVEIIFKEKNSRDKIASYPEVVKLYDQLQNHEHCSLVGVMAETSEVSAICDLNLSICFTSPTVEALGARKRAIFFDPTSKFVGTYYDQFPKLVAHNYEELKQLVQYWLNEATDEDFNRWIDQYIVGEIDTFADGQAITRMRHELIKKNGER